MLRLLRSLAAAALVLSASTIPASSALAATSSDDADPGAGTGTTWAVEPSDADGPDGRVSLRHDVESGAAVSDFVVVTNFGERPATFAVYASDGVVNADGNFDLLPADTEPVDGGAWVEIGDVDGATPRDGGGIVLEAPASSSTVIPVEITVPANATPGDHPAGVVAELVQGDDTSVQMSSRVGVRLHLRVPGEIVAQVQPQDITATYSPSWNPFAPGTVTLEYSLNNVGNIRVGADVDASVAGPFGIGGGETSSEHREILPGQSTADAGQFEAWPLFLGRGDVTAVPMGVGEDQVPDELMASSAAFTVWMVPWSQLILLALLVAAPLLIVKARKRSAAKVQARIDAAVAAAAAPSAADTDAPAEPAADVADPR
ncbi:COG1470 family protein [Georgenia sunbinii]|uniref:COG1470 family protein n=1 Tax=Georgenia sunbinii TaxID=3117728 RepID=UPI002F26AA18